MLRIELAVDPRLAPPRTGRWEVALRGNGYSVAGELAPGDVRESLDPGRAGVDILSMSRLRVVSALGEQERSSPRKGRGDHSGWEGSREDMTGQIFVLRMVQRIVMSMLTAQSSAGVNGVWFDLTLLRVSQP